jgi:hypothetical protein
MTIDIRRANPAFRRLMVIAFVAATTVGALLVTALDRYQPALVHWIQSDPAMSAQRGRLVVLVLAGCLTAPLFGTALYLWLLGEKMVRTQEYPPPGFRVIRDTAVIRGEGAIARGRLFKVLALGCGLAAIAIGLLLWRLASLPVHRAS